MDGWQKGFELEFYRVQISFALKPRADDSIAIDKKR
jgi:hypothetical protein